MEYLHKFQVAASIENVRHFHLQPRSMGMLTPPPILVRIHRSPAVMAEDESMEFTLWLGPLPIRWTATFSDIGEVGFTDTQSSGPFRRWIHRHSFRAIDEGTTEITDEITVELDPRLDRFLLGLFLWLGLPFLFAYRSWRTRQIIAAEQDRSNQGGDSAR